MHPSAISRFIITKKRETSNISFNWKTFFKKIVKRQLNNTRKCFPLIHFSPTARAINRTKGEQKAKQEGTGKYKGSGEKNRATRYSPKWGQTVSAIKRSSAVRKFGPHIDGLLIIFHRPAFLPRYKTAREIRGTRRLRVNWPPQNFLLRAAFDLRAMFPVRAR